MAWAREGPARASPRQGADRLQATGTGRCAQPVWRRGAADFIPVSRMTGAGAGLRPAACCRAIPMPVEWCLGLGPSPWLAAMRRSNRAGRVSSEPIERPSRKSRSRPCSLAISRAPLAVSRRPDVAAAAVGRPGPGQSRSWARIAEASVIGQMAVDQVHRRLVKPGRCICRPGRQTTGWTEADLTITRVTLVARRHKEQQKVA